MQKDEMLTEDRAIQRRHDHAENFLTESGFEAMELLRDEYHWRWGYTFRRQFEDESEEIVLRKWWQDGDGKWKYRVVAVMPIKEAESLVGAMQLAQHRGDAAD